MVDGDDYGGGEWLTVMIMVVVNGYDGDDYGGEWL